MGNIKFFVSAAFGLIALHNVMAENLVENGNMERGTANWLGALDVKEDSSGKKMLIITPENNIVKTRRNIPVDIKKTYRLSGKFQAEGKFSQLLFGFLPVNGNGLPIMPQNVNVLPGTETEIIADIVKGQTKVLVKDASKWLTSKKQTFMALNADDSGEYKDLPNFTLSAEITAVAQKDNGWELTLSSGMNAPATAGTKVRQHESGNTYIYAATSNMFTDEKMLDGIISGVALQKNINSQWRKGTVAAKLIILVLYEKNDAGKITFGDIVFEEIIPSSL